MYRYFFLLFFCWACSSPRQKQEVSTTLKDSIRPPVKDTLVVIKKPLLPATNDSLNAMASLMAGTWSGGIYENTGNSEAYKSFAASFEKRWRQFDSSRISLLQNFSSNELAPNLDTTRILFYPFSGPDYLYPGIFFPEKEKIIMVGLEPVGTFPDFKAPKDSAERYFKKINSSLNAILKFSFFRTESMKKDLKSGELDGTLHLLFLFLNRAGNKLVSARPVTLDTNGIVTYLEGFHVLEKEKLTNEGIEIRYIEGDKLKELVYFSMDASDYYLRNNHGFMKFMNAQGEMSVYLKGASYLLHKTYFSKIRGLILDQAQTIVQDDSGIALKYFRMEKNQWEFKLYGQYTRPIALFTGLYQPLLDSLYRQQGAKKLDFGLGYNFKDKNSNFMIAGKKQAGGAKL